MLFTHKNKKLWKKLKQFFSKYHIANEVGPYLPECAHSQRNIYNLLQLHFFQNKAQGEEEAAGSCSIAKSEKVPSTHMNAINILTGTRSCSNPQPWPSPSPPKAPPASQRTSPNFGPPAIQSA